MTPEIIAQFGLERKVQVPTAKSMEMLLDGLRQDFGYFG